MTPLNTTLSPTPSFSESDCKQTQVKDTTPLNTTLSPTESFSENDCKETQVKDTTPLKITFGPIASFSVTNAEKMETGTHKEEASGLLIINSRKRHINDFSVMWMNELSMKKRRSTRLLRRQGTDTHGSVFLDFPVFKKPFIENDNSSNSRYVMLS